MSPIGWCDETLNPIVGCTANCVDPEGRPYCYARRMAARSLTNCPQCASFTPHFHPERLEKLAHWKKPRRIFMDSMSDWWDPKVPQEWRDECYRAMAANPQHRYLVLTKQPLVRNLDLVCMARAAMWHGRTVEGKPQEYRQTAGFLPDFISAEPLFSVFDLHPDIAWLILGADSRRNPYLPGEQAFVEMIRQADDLGIPVYVKDNALKHYPGLPVRRELPEGLQLEEPTCISE